MAFMSLQFRRRVWVGETDLVYNVRKEWGPRAEPWSTPRARGQGGGDTRARPVEGAGAGSSQDAREE